MEIEFLNFGIYLASSIPADFAALLSKVIVRLHFAWFAERSMRPVSYTHLGVGKRYAGLEWLKLGQQRIPVDKEVAALIPYRGPQGSFHYISATDVLTRHVAPALLKDKIVLVGTTAAGLLDLRATPVQNVYAGVEIHANMIAGILDNNIKEQPAYTAVSYTHLNHTKIGRASCRERV